MPEPVPAAVLDPNGISQVELVHRRDDAAQSIRVWRVVPKRGLPIVAKWRRGHDVARSCGQEYERLVEGHHALRAHDHCGAPGVVTHAVGDGLIVMYAADGFRLRGLVKKPDFRDGNRMQTIERIGRALAELHNSAPTLPQKFDPRFLRSQSPQIVRYLGNPELGQHFRDMSAHITTTVIDHADRISGRTISTVKVHGDLGLNNLFVSPARVTFIDFEHVSRRAAAFDVANILVRIENAAPAPREAVGDDQIVSRSDMVAFARGYGTEIFESPVWTLHMMLAVRRLLNNLCGDEIINEGERATRLAHVERMVAAF